MAKKQQTRKGKPDTSDENSISATSAGKDSTAATRFKEKLEQDGGYTEMELPEVKDIPGQENIRKAGVPGAMADTTISSDDEEGIKDGHDIFREEDDEVKIVMGTEADVTKEDLVLLGDPDKDMDEGDDELTDNKGLDDIDDDGDPLNEAAADMDSDGEDLDIPGEDSKKARRNKKVGEEDEENDYYSLGSSDNDEMNEGTP